MVKYSDKMTFCKNRVSDKKYYWNEVSEKNDKKEILKTLLDGFSGRDTKEYLLSIIENFNDKSDCQYYFIKEPEILNFISGNLCIKIDYPQKGNILLISRYQLNSNNAEYYPYALYSKLNRYENLKQYLCYEKSPYKDKLFSFKGEKIDYDCSKKNFTYDEKDYTFDEIYEELKSQIL